MTTSKFARPRAKKAHVTKPSSTLIPNQPGFPFLKLPGELRNRIYEFACGPDQLITFVSSKHTNRQKQQSCQTSVVVAVAPLRTSATIARVCKQIYKESNSFIYTGVFAFETRCTFVAFMTKIKRNTNLIRKVVIGWGHFFGTDLQNAVETHVKDTFKTENKFEAALFECPDALSGLAIERDMMVSEDMTGLGDELDYYAGMWLQNLSSWVNEEHDHEALHFLQSLKITLRPAPHMNNPPVAEPKLLAMLEEHFLEEIDINLDGMAVRL